GEGDGRPGGIRTAATRHRRSGGAVPRVRALRLPLRAPDPRRGAAPHADGLATSTRWQRGDGSLRGLDDGPDRGDAAAGGRARHPPHRRAGVRARARSGPRPDASEGAGARPGVLARELEGYDRLFPRRWVRRMARTDG